MALTVLTVLTVLTANASASASQAPAAKPLSRLALPLANALKTYLKPF